MFTLNKIKDKYTELSTNPLNPLRFSLAIFIFSFLIYIPSLFSDFVDWDDNLYILQATALTAPWSDFTAWAFNTMYRANYHPFTWLSYKLDYFIWGYNPFGYHLTNNILHGLNSILVFFVTKKLITRYYYKNESVENREKIFTITIITTILFIIHPTHVESISWVSERKDLLYAFFYLSSIYCYMKYLDVPNKNNKFYILALLIFTFSCLSKAMAVTLPAILLIIDLCPYNRFSIKMTINEFVKITAEKIPFFIITGIFSLLAIDAQRLYGAMIDTEVYPLLNRVAGYILSMDYYILKLVAPLDLAPYHPFLYFLYFTVLTSPVFIAAVAFFLTVLIYSLYKGGKGDFISISLLSFFLITILPTSNFFQLTNKFIAERYLYIPSLAFFILAGIATSQLLTSKHKNLITVLTLSIFICFSILNIKQQYTWRDSITLWTQEIKIYGDKDHTGHYARGEQWLKRGNLENAIFDFTNSLKVLPSHAKSFNYRGVALANQKKHSLAISDFEQAIKYDPKYAAPYFNLARAYNDLGNKEAGSFFTDFYKVLEKEKSKEN